MKGDMAPDSDRRKSFVLRREKQSQWNQMSGNFMYSRPKKSKRFYVLEIPEGEFFLQTFKKMFQKRIWILY